MSELPAVADEDIPDSARKPEAGSDAEEEDEPKAKEVSVDCRIRRRSG